MVRDVAGGEFQTPRNKIACDKLCELATLPLRLLELGPSAASGGQAAFFLTRTFGVGSPSRD